VTNVRKHIIQSFIFGIGY